MHFRVTKRKFGHLINLGVHTMNKKVLAKFHGKTVISALKRDPGVVAPSNSKLSEAVKLMA